MYRVKSGVRTSPSKASPGHGTGEHVFLFPSDSAKCICVYCILYKQKKPLSMCKSYNVSGLLPDDFSYMPLRASSTPYHTEMQAIYAPFAII